MHFDAELSGFRSYLVGIEDLGRVHYRDDYIPRSHESLAGPSDPSSFPSRQTLNRGPMIQVPMGCACSSRIRPETATIGFDIEVRPKGSLLVVHPSKLDSQGLVF